MGTSSGDDIFQNPDENSLQSEACGRTPELEVNSLETRRDAGEKVMRDITSAISKANLKDPPQLQTKLKSCMQSTPRRDSICLFVWFLTTHQPLWVISVRRY